MKNVTFVDSIFPNGKTATFAIIDQVNGEFTSMLKSTYEAMQTEVTNEPR